MEYEEQTFGTVKTPKKPDIEKWADLTVNKCKSENKINDEKKLTVNTVWLPRKRNISQFYKKICWNFFPLVFPTVRWDAR